MLRKQHDIACYRRGGPLTITDVKASASGELFVLGDFTGSVDLGAGVVTAVGGMVIFLHESYI